MSRISIGARWLRLCHEVAFPRQLDFGIFFLRLCGDTARCARRQVALQTCPAGTVGAALAAFLRDHDLRLVPGYERHDLKHVLLGFGVDAADEMRMQAFMTGNAGVSKETVMALAFLAWTPDMWAEVPRHLATGRRAARLGELDFDVLIRRDLEAVRAELKISPSIHQRQAW